MGKKFRGANSKAVEARNRKDEAKNAEKERLKKQAEDEKWKVTDKRLLAKQKKEAEQKRKQEEARKRKEEAKKLFEKEQKELEKYGKPTNTKMTLAKRAEQREKEKLERERKMQEREEQKKKIVKPIELEENQNKSKETVVDASNIDDALDQLSLTGNSSSTASTVDLHPEKRMKAAFKAYEEQRLPVMRKENPSLRLQQVRNMLWEEWKKSPENPMVQAKLAKQRELMERS